MFKVNNKDTRTTSAGKVLISERAHLSESNFHLDRYNSLSRNLRHPCLSNILTDQIFYSSCNGYFFVSTNICTPTPKSGQTHSNNSSATADELFQCV